MLICAENVLLLYGETRMCWMCGCADHIGLGNDRDIVDSQSKESNDIIEK